MIVVRIRETKAIICEVETEEVGLEMIEEYESVDVEEGIYTPEFYEVAEI